MIDKDKVIQNQNNHICYMCKKDLSKDDSKIYMIGYLYRKSGYSHYCYSIDFNNKKNLDARIYFCVHCWELLISNLLMFDPNEFKSNDECQQAKK